MSTEHTITRKAADGTLTVGELRSFLADLGTSEDVREAAPKVRIAGGGGIKSITVTVPGEGEQRDG